MGTLFFVVRGINRKNFINPISEGAYEYGKDYYEKKDRECYSRRCI